MLVICKIECLTDEFRGLCVRVRISSNQTCAVSLCYYKFSALFVILPIALSLIDTLSVMLRAIIT